MFNQLKTAVSMTLILTLITGFIYPMLVTVLAQTFFPSQASGSLIIKNKNISGSKLIGQNFTSDKYFHSRPSESNYDGTKSGGSNLGPTSKKLIDKIISTAKGLEKENPNISPPADLITASGSGLDPHISIAGAEFQIPRVAIARGISEGALHKLVVEHIEKRQFGILGELRVNVLTLNLALDNFYSK
ncbi:MAG: potassium-transporting ATPase subunit KdpC [Candidatus Melainabacteria bacterium]|nr:potassium-transporting ATPase subunit KdpC [Candidatus Melainabacteria bacterium]